MTDANATRAALILTVERLALVFRYGVWLVVFPLYLADLYPGHVGDIVIYTVLVAFHNAFAHWVLWTERHDLFRSPLNFVIYFVEATAITGITGPEESDAWVLYILVLIGYGAYTGRFKSTILVTALCAIALAAVIGVEYLRVGIRREFGEIAGRFLYLGAAGWLTASLSERLWRSERDAIAREQAVASSEAVLRTILDSAADPIVVFDEDEFITEANDPACAFLEIERAELLGRRVREFLFDDGTLPSKAASLLERGEARVEEIIIAESGEERNVEIVVRSFVRQGKRFFVAVWHDISRRRELSEAIRLANDRREHLERELEQVERLRSHLIRFVSQRLRSPLTALLGYVDMLLDEELGPISADQRKALATCQRSVLRAFHVLDDVVQMDELVPGDGETTRKTT